MIASKRPRESPSTILYLVEEAHQAVTTTQRVRVLEKIAMVSEGTPLVKAGILRPLCLQLGFVLNRSIATESETDQVSMVCSAIDSLYRNCREDVRMESLDDIGIELLRLLSKAWKNQKAQSKVVSIWRSISASARGAMMTINIPNFLPMMAEALQNNAVSKCMKGDIMSVLKCVSHFADDHRLSLLEQLGTVLSRTSCLELTERGMERLSAIFRNLSLTPNVRIVMAEHSAVLTALVQLCSKGSQNMKTIRNVTSTFDNLSMETDSCMMLLLHGDGMILEALRHLLLLADDDVVRRRCARALRFLARDKAVPILLKCTDVIHSLHQAAIHDRSVDVRSEATSAYASCAAKVNAKMAIHGDILNALRDMASGPASASVAFAFKEQVLHPGNRIAIVEHADFFETMVGKCFEPNASFSLKEYVCSALEILSQDERIRDKMLSESVLNVLVHCAREGEETTAQHAVRALLNLASTESTRKRLVTHRGLLQTLIRYSKSCRDVSAKESVKNTMLVLIPQI
ncbi:hypothetical protein MHU86_19848 [Fragilaria crotonensis]|nr:hypothetical protein MHU86_19848 [Fragilaria crotonensis]